MEASFCDCEFDERPDVFRESKRKARKEHHCCECGVVIKVGEMYEHTTGRWDRFFSTFKTCLTCARLRRDYCAPYGDLRVEIWERLGVDYLGVWAEDG